jgi:hypothetical protein
MLEDLGLVPLSSLLNLPQPPQSLLPPQPETEPLDSP